MKTLKQLLLITSVTLLGSLASATAQLVNSADRTFLQQTSQGASFEVIGGQLPVSHSGNAVVRRFGSLIVRNNAREFTQLRALALRVGVPISTQPSSEGIQDLQSLGQLFNLEFDRKYVSNEILTILSDIRASLTVIRDGQNLAVRAFARRRLPTLYAELQQGLITAQRIGLQLK